MRRRAFTLTEMLIVVAILAVLIALLMPALASARRAAYLAAQQAEFETLAQALESFRAAHGEYPPSRLILDERGDYSPAHLAATLAPGERGLAARSLAAMGRLFPRVKLSTTGPVPTLSIPGGYYDFNGNGQLDPSPTVVTGDEALVFWLSGVGRLPTNPWRPGEARAGYAWRPGSLADPDGDDHKSLADQLAGRPVAYFASSGPHAYDPGDVDDTGEATTRYRLASGDVISPGPNPYTDGPPSPTNGPARFHRPQSFQLVAAGIDGRYGAGGEWSGAEGRDPLPGDGRDDERDNATNFRRGKLGD